MNIKAYTAWSLLDKFEWDEGYSERFGLYYVDFRDKNKPRYPKASVQYYKSIISSNGFPNQREVKSLYGCSQSRVKHIFSKTKLIVNIIFDVPIHSFSQLESWKGKAIETCSSSNQLLAAGKSNTSHYSEELGGAKTKTNCYFIQSLTGILFVLPLQLEDCPRKIRNLQESQRLGLFMMKFRYKDRLMFESVCWCPGGCGGLCVY